MRKFIVLGVLVLGVVVYGFTLIDVDGSGEISANTILVALLAAGLYPAWRLGRLVMAQALRSE